MACISCRISLFEFHKITSDEQDLISFLQKHGVLPENVECPHCKKLCKFYPNDDFRFRCTNTWLTSGTKKKRRKISCNFSLSAKKETIFEQSRLKLHTSCKFISLWLVLPSPKQTLLQQEFNFSTKTVVDLCSFCRAVCLRCMVEESEITGGPYKVVNIIEAKMGNRGRVIEEQWIFCGIENNSNKCFFVPVDVGCKDTLLEVIRKWILPGTTIVSKCWKTYECLADKRFQLEKVNHLKNFVDPDTGAYAKSIERQWKNVHSEIPRSGRGENNFAGHLAECQFRTKYSNHRDRFHHFFKHARHAYPPEESGSEVLQE